MTPEEIDRWRKVEQMRVDVCQVCLEQIDHSSVFKTPDAMARHILRIVNPPIPPEAA